MWSQRADRLDSLDYALRDCKGGGYVLKVLKRQSLRDPLCSCRSPFLSPHPKDDIYCCILSPSFREKTGRDFEAGWAVRMITSYFIPSCFTVISCFRCLPTLSMFSCSHSLKHLIYHLSISLCVFLLLSNIHCTLYTVAVARNQIGGSNIIQGLGISEDDASRRSPESEASP